MNRGMARVLGALSAVLLFAGLVIHDAGAQETLVGTWKAEQGWTLEIARDPSDTNKLIGTLKEGQAEQTLEIAKDPGDANKLIGNIKQAGQADQTTDAPDIMIEHYVQGGKSFFKSRKCRPPPCRDWEIWERLD